MKTRHSNQLNVAALAAALSLLSQVAVASDWQERRLMQPSAAERASEDAGQVFIYDRLDEAIVDTALDSNFGRMENMMFVRVRHTEPNGAEWEDEDCD